MKHLLRSYVIVFITCFGLISNYVGAQQASTYVFTDSKPGYTSITGTSLVSGASSWNSGLVFTNVPIGFTFYFEGQPYTTVGVSSNGFVWFGTGTASTTEYNPISDASLGTGSITGAVAAYGTQLDAFATNNLSGSPTGEPEISYTTTGSTCSQVFTVQWKGAYAVSDPGSQGEFGDLERMDLQIQLDETTNDIVIQDNVDPYPYLGSSSAEVGVRGASNADFVSLTCWTAGCSQNTNNAATATLDPKYPATGSKFTFAPPACSYTAPVTETNASCGNNGTLTITETGGTGTFTYIINNGTTADTSSTGAFTGLGPGTYITATTNGSCAVTGCTTITSAATTPTASNTGPTCIGGTVTLSTPTISGATYGWTGPNGFTSSSQDTTITITSAADTGIYSVYDTIGGCASNPGTTNVTITSPATPVAGANTPCVGGTLNLTDNVSGVKYSWTGPNGFTSHSQDTSISNVTLADTGTYSVVDTVSGCASLPGTVHVVINSPSAAPAVGSNSPVCAGDSLKLIDSVSGAVYSWTGPNTYSSTLQNPAIANVTIADTGTYTVTNTVGGCASLPATLHVTVNPVPATPTAGSNSPVCSGSTITLTSSASAGTYHWTGPNGFKSSSEDTSISNAVATDTGTYSVVDSVLGCASLPGTTHVAINATSAAPKVGSNSPVCQGSTLTLTDSVNGATYGWTGPNSYASSQQDPGITNVAVADSGAYTVVDTVNGCVSAPATIHVVVNATPSTPNVGSNSPVCVGSFILLTDYTNATSYSWTGPHGFASASQDTSITNAVVTDSGTYTVVNTVSGCSSQPASVHIIINPIPPTPTLGSNSPVCVGSGLSLTNSTGATKYKWTGPNGFTSSAQDTSISSVIAADSGTYSVVDSVAGCASAPGTVHVTVNSPPVIDSISANTPVCQGSTLNLYTLNLDSSGVSGATYSWIGPFGFIAGTPAASRVNIQVADSGYYVVTDSVPGCASVSDSVDVSVTPGPPPVNASNDGPVCAGQAVGLSADSVAGVTYTWSGPNGFVSHQRDTTILNSAVSESGVYTVTIAASGGCGTSSNETTVVINPLPTQPVVGSNSPVCSGSDLNLTVASQTNATYTWSGPGAYTSDIDSPVINNIAAGDSGYYVVTVTQGSCGSLTDSVKVSIVPNVPVVVGNNGPVCAGQAILLNATNINGAAYSWTGPNGYTSSQSEDTIQNAIAANAGNYILSTTNGLCGTQIDTTTVTVNPVPTIPDMGSNGPLCAGGNLDLTVVPQTGAIYSWSGPQGFIAFVSNPVINDATSLDSGYYYVTVTVGSCGSLSDSELVSISPLPPAVTASNNGPICTNQSLQLNVTAVANATYNWSGPQGFTGNTQSPTVANINTTEAGTYYVTVTNSCGTSTDSTTVQVITSALPPVLSSNSPICIGNTLGLYSLSEPGATYAWSGPNSFTSNTDSTAIGNIQLSDSGVYTLSVSIPGCGTASANIDVTVKTGLPQPTFTSNSPICQGDTLKLSGEDDYPAGVTNYSWFNPQDSAISTSPSTFVAHASPANSGTYVYYVVSGGCTGIDSVNVIIDPLPIVKLPSANYCNGDSAVLDAAGGYAIYHWSNNSNDSILVINAQDTSIKSSVTVTDHYGCSNSVTVTSTFLPKPDTIIVNQDGDTLISSWSNALSFQWYVDNNSIFNATGNSFVIDSSGTYFVAVTDSNGCTWRSADVYVIALGINAVNANNNQLMLYPNPASGSIFLSAPEMIGNYVVYDAEGKEITRVEGLKTGKTSIDLQGWAKGVYFLHATIGGEPVSRKFVIIE